MYGMNELAAWRQPFHWGLLIAFDDQGLQLADLRHQKFERRGSRARPNERLADRCLVGPTTGCELRLRGGEVAVARAR